ncbi:MAG TPA: ABC transporter ATP-binding protein [Jatrophihabitans sp.]|jgi:ATP-binding cassette subfamily B protein
MSENGATPDRVSAGSTGGTGPAKRIQGAENRRGPGGGPPWMGAAMPAEKSMNFWPSARRLLRTMRPERIKLYVVLVLALGSVTMSVLGPIFLGKATDAIFAGVMGKLFPAGLSLSAAVDQVRGRGDSTYAEVLAHSGAVPGHGIDFGHLGVVLLCAIGVYFGGSLLSWVQGYLLNGIVQNAIRRLRTDVEEKIHRLPLPYFDRQQRGELLSRVTNDIDNIQQTLSQTMSQLLVALLTVVGVLVMMFTLSWVLALIALVAVPVSMLVTKFVAKRSQSKFIQQWRNTGQLNGQIEEAFTGLELVKVFGRQKEIQASFDTKNQELYEASFGAQFVSGTIMPLMMFIGNLNYVAVAVVGGLRVASGAMSLGDVQAFIQYSRQFTQPLTQVASMANVLQSGVASAERVFDLLDAEEQLPDPVSPARPVQMRGRVEFENVSFRYVPDQPLIEDLSLVAEPGHTIAIVGHTGAGKTTLVNLVMRFYEIDAGRITLDGVDIRDMARADLRGEIGMVLQDTWLFGGTIRDNIGYGRPSGGAPGSEGVAAGGATEEEILAAAKAAYVDGFVQALPNGYDTVIDEESSNFSAGQKQLMTIARAFLAQPSLLILDEATSSVDTRTEVQVQHAMAALRSNRTSFVIAHRLSTIRDADLILVMDAGRIVEQGTHTELLAAHGAYFELYNSQFSAAIEEDVVA